MRHEWKTLGGTAVVADEPLRFLLNVDPGASGVRRVDDVLMREILRLAERVKELEDANESLRRNRESFDAVSVAQLAKAIARIGDLEAERDRLSNELHGANVANELLAKENSRLALSDAGLTSLRLEMETERVKSQQATNRHSEEADRLRKTIDRLTGDRVVSAHIEHLQLELSVAQQAGAALRRDLAAAIRTGEELARERDGWKKEALWLDRHFLRARERLRAIDALLSSEEPPEGLLRAIWNDPQTHKLADSPAHAAWRWFREQFASTESVAQVNSPKAENPVHLSSPWYRATTGAKVEYGIPGGAVSVRVEIHDHEPPAWRVVFSGAAPVKGGDELREVNGFTQAEVSRETGSDLAVRANAMGRGGSGLADANPPSIQDILQRSQQRVTTPASLMADMLNDPVRSGQQGDEAEEPAAELPLTSTPQATLNARDIKTDQEAAERRKDEAADAELGRLLVAILQNHCGERSDSEGAIHTLERIIREREDGIASDRLMIAQAHGEVAALRAEGVSQRAELREQDARILALLEILREAQWTWGQREPATQKFCPVCLASYEEGHSTACRLGLALAGKVAPSGEKAKILAYLESHAGVSGPEFAWHLRQIKARIEAGEHLADSITVSLPPYAVVEEQERADKARRGVLDGIVERKLEGMPTEPMIGRGGRVPKPWFAGLSMEEIHQNILLGKAPGSGQPGEGVLVPEGFLNWLSDAKRPPAGPVEWRTFALTVGLLRAGDRHGPYVIPNNARNARVQVIYEQQVHDESSE